MCSRDKSGALVYLSYSGVVDITPELGLVLGGSPDAKTTEFGNSCKPVFPQLFLFSELHLLVFRLAFSPPNTLLLI